MAKACVNHWYHNRLSHAIVLQLADDPGPYIAHFPPTHRDGSSYRSTVRFRTLRAREPLHGGDAWRGMSGQAVLPDRFFP